MDNLMRDNKLKITSIEAIRNNLRIHFECSGLVGRFFNKDVFFAKYDTSIEGVPESTLIIPFLATCLPVVWASKADLYVETIDESFLDGLKEIKSSLQKFYPQIGFGGNIHAGKIVKSSVNGYSKSMMLFTGGVDSLTTYIRHRSEKPIIVSIQGSPDINIDNPKAWDIAMKNLQSFSEKTESKIMTINSNFNKIDNSLLLDSYYGRYITGNWWCGVKHGLALLGLCAPITYKEKVNKLYIASSYTKLFPYAWGSHPDIDNNVRWAGTIVEHDGYELSRQDKIEVIADYIQKEDPDLYLRTCTRLSKKGLNCSKCEKCSRTITGLELAGIDPNNHGYNVNADTFKLIRKKISEGLFHFGEDEQYMWEDLQRHCDLDKDFPHSEAKELATWLLDINIENIKSKSNKAISLHNFLYTYVFYLKYFPDPLPEIIKLLGTVLIWMS